MLNKYLTIAILALAGLCIILYNLWDSTKAELNSLREYSKTLEVEIERRNENEKNLSKRISELNRIYNSNPDYSNTAVPAELADRLRKSCKACK